MSATIPESLIDLLERPVVVAFGTTNPGGQPQVTPVWASLEGDQIWINSAVGRRKDRNIRANPKVSVMAMDPENPYRWLEVRGEVVALDDSEAAVAHINKLSGMYVGNDDYYSFNPGNRDQESRVIYKIQPTRVNGE